MADETLLRTVATVTAADKFDPDNTFFKHREPLKAAPYTVEPYCIPPTSGQAQPGSNNVRFRIPKSANVLGRVFLTGILAPCTIGGGNATFIRYVDYVVLSLCKEIRVKNGTQLLQTLRPLEMFIYFHRWFDNEQRVNLQSFLLGPLSQAERNQRAKKPQDFRMPLPLFWCDDESKYLQMFPLAHEFDIEIDFEESKYLFQANGTWATPATDAAVFQKLELEVEYHHTLDTERDAMGEQYKSADGVQLTYLEAQYIPQDTTTVAASQSLNAGTLEVKLDNLNKAAQSMHVILRWDADLRRTCALMSAPSTSYGEFGCDRFNLGGWLDPKYTPYATAYPTHGNPSPMITHIEMKSNNNYILRKTKVKDLINNNAGWRYFFAGGGEILSIPFCKFPTHPNACTGALDFSAIPNPRMILYLNTSDWSVGGTDYTTVGNYATADIGESSALAVDVVTFNLDTINITNHGITKPFA